MKLKKGDLLIDKRYLKKRKGWNWEWKYMFYIGKDSDWAYNANGDKYYYDLFKVSLTSIPTSKSKHRIIYLDATNDERHFKNYKISIVDTLKKL